VQQASLFTDEGRSDNIFSRLKKYGLVEEKTDDLINKISLASNWADDLISENAFEISIEQKEKNAVMELVNRFKNLIGKESENLSNDIQTIIFEISKKHEIEPRVFFKLLYRMLINSDRGPKLGNYLVDLGLDRTCEIIEKYI